jgi:signal transduction histidine kinase
VQFLGGKAESILGVSEADAIGRDCVSVFRPVGLEKHPLLEGLRRAPRPLELYLAQPKGGEIPVSLQLWRARPDESRVAAGKSARASADSEAHAVRLVAFFTDLSEERSLGEAERQKDRLAVLGELSAGIAHEIRNPLTGIANCAQVLRESLDPDHSGQRFLTIISDEVARLNRIVEGLLGYARPNRPELREGDIEATVRRAVELTHAELDAAGIRSELRVRSRIPSIYFDAHQIEQVLLNLIQNARDAMPGGGELRIDLGLVKRLPHRRRGAGRRASDRVRYVEDPPRARFVQVKITDTGSGISDEILSRIWNPFFTTRPRGTGLGLSLSQSIVREHGGFLTLRSVVSKGTTALLDLPVERRQGERRRNAD